MKTVSKGKLKAKMLEYLRHVEATGEEIIITNHNIPTLKIVPIKKKTDISSVFADVRGKVHIDDSIMEPETEEWDI